MWFQRLWKKPTAESVTLETIGLINGATKLGKANQSIATSAEAVRQAHKIDRILKDNRKAMEPEITQFLSQSRRHLIGLTEIECMTSIQIVTPADCMAPASDRNPAWDRRYDAFQAQMGPAAEKMAAWFAGPTGDAAPNAPLSDRASAGGGR
ncbi:MAG: hypothetical protein KI792_08095 [Alphaproteobacteria bacterium]|nr:hypothetical protein [Alphaproteobacteria bacterium SS10]